MPLPQWPRPRMAASFYVSARPRISCAGAKSGAVEPAIDAPLAHCLRHLVMDASGIFGGETCGSHRPLLALHRDALRDWRAARQHAVEIHVMPVRREMNPIIVIPIAIHQSGQGGERQV